MNLYKMYAKTLWVVALFFWDIYNLLKYPFLLCAFNYFADIVDNLNIKHKLNLWV